MGNVLVNDAYLYGIADAIRVKNGSTEKYLPSEMPSAIEGIQSGGANAFEYATGFYFKGAVFPDDYDFSESIYTLENESTYINFSQVKGLKSIKLISNNINSSGYLANANMFMQNKDSSQIEKIDLSEFITVFKSATNTFSGCAALREIVGKLDFSQITLFSSTFNNCSSLEEVRFKENSIMLNLSLGHSKYLSDESIQSIIDGLAIVETSQKLTLHATTKAKLTESQISQITSKNWTLA